MAPTYAPLASAGESDSSGANKNGGGAQVLTRVEMGTRAGRASAGQARTGTMRMGGGVSDESGNEHESGSESKVHPSFLFLLSIISADTTPPSRDRQARADEVPSK